MTKKILVLTDSLNTEDSSGSKVNVAFIKNLVKFGFEIQVLSLIVPKGLEFEFLVDEIKPIKKWSYFLSRLQRRIQRIANLNLSVFLENKFGFSFTFFNESSSLQNGLENYNPKNYDLVITLSKGESFRPHHAVLNNKYWHSKWLAYVHDPYPFQNYPRPYTFKPKGARQKDLFFKEVATCCRFAGFPSLLLAEHMASFYPEFNKKKVILPHQYQISKESVKLPTFFIEGKFNLVHAGNLLGGRSPEGLLKGFHLFLNNFPEALGVVNLYLVGPYTNYKNLISDYKNTTGLIVNSNIPYRQAILIQQEASVNIILEASDTDFSPFLPAKVAHSIFFDKPILALSPEKSEVRRLLSTDYPWQCKADDASQIAQHIYNLYINWKSQPQTLNRPDLQEYFSSNYLGENINQLIDEV
tara:strand:- start:3762 stop:5000 length:1239 start_codon:yes stop_codon:yes gene_type:complete